MRSFDLIIIGGGAAGITVAKGPAAIGWRIALIEKEFMGGTCTNVGCMPTKALLSSAHFLHRARHADKLGLHIPEAFGEWTTIQQRMVDFVKRLRAGSERFPAQYDNITFFRGEAHFTGPKTVTVNNEEISSDKIVIAAGARSFIAPVPGLEDIEYLTSTSALQLPALPDRLAILGGGVLSIEFAQIFSRLGVNVIIIEQNEKILGGFDDDISDTFRAILESEGIHVMTGYTVCKVAKHNSKIKVLLEKGDRPEEVLVSSLMVATGRQPNSDRLNLCVAGIEADERGFIKIDKAFATNIEGVWAIGDITGGLMFTHRSRNDGTLLSDLLTTGKPIDHRHRVIPSAVYTDPEIAVVGESEKSARNKGIEFISKKLPYGKIARAGAETQTEGFIKILADPKNLRIIGAQIIGEAAGEIMHTVIMAIYLNGTVYDLQDMLSIHPTYAEGLYSTAMLF